MDALKRSGKEIIPTPVWVLGVRIAQLVISVIVLALAGWFMHGLYNGSLGFVVVCWLFTWIIALYNIVAEKVPAARKSYNTWATLSLDALMILFWLSAMAANAHYRSLFVVDVMASCTSDGSLVNSGHCVTWKRDVATDRGLAALSSVAGLSAVIMLLFVVSFAYVCHFFRLSLKGNHESNLDLEKNGNVTISPYAATEMNGDMPATNAQPQGEPLLHQQHPASAWQTGPDVGGQQAARYYSGQQPYNPYQGATPAQQPTGSPQASVPYHQSQ